MDLEYFYRSFENREQFEEWEKQIDPAKKKFIDENELRNHKMKREAVKQDYFGKMFQRSELKRLNEASEEDLKKFVNMSRDELEVFFQNFSDKSDYDSWLALIDYKQL